MGMNMPLPIKDGIKKYIEKKRISFCMPGHKGKNVSGIKDIFKYDVTELDDTDNLLNPCTYIKNSEENLAKVYGTLSSHYLLGGSTSGIYSMVSLAVSEGDKIIVDRFCHKSVISAIILCGAVPVYVKPSYNAQFGFVGGMIADEIDFTIRRHSDAKAVILTSPTYYGTVSDIRAISDIVHNAGLLLLVDEAHGAHFHISDVLPQNALCCGADMSVHSVHKTLGAMSGGGLLHINTSKVSKSQIRSVLSMYQSTSPSYGCLSVLEGAVFDALNQDKKYRELTDAIDKCRKIVNSQGKAYWIGEELIGKCEIYDMDKTRIVINFSNLNLTGYNAANILREKYNIEVEMADENNIVCIVTPYNSTGDVKTLCRAVVNMTEKTKPVPRKTEIFKYPDHEISLLPRKAYFSPSETVELSESISRVSAATVCKYPPGIALVVPGEMIRAEHIRKISDTLEKGGTITGLSSGMSIDVVK